MTAPTELLERHLAEHGPWCLGAGRTPHVVPPEELTVADGGAVLCAVCWRRRGDGRLAQLADEHAGTPLGDRLAELQRDLQDADAFLAQLTDADVALLDVLEEFEERHHGERMPR